MAFAHSSTSSGVCLHTHCPLWPDVVGRIKAAAAFLCSRVVTGVPRRAGTSYGSCREWCQAGSVDQRISGCSGKIAMDLNKVYAPNIIPSHCESLWLCIERVVDLLLQGLGLVVTGTLPVFNLTMDGNSQVKTTKTKVIVVNPNNSLIMCDDECFFWLESAHLRCDGSWCASRWDQTSDATVQRE